MRLFNIHIYIQNIKHYCWLSWTRWKHNFLGKN